MTIVPVNRVAASGIITIDLATFKPQFDIVEIDISQFLWKGLVLKEKEFRQAIKSLVPRDYEGKVVTAYCSTDAIVPTWAYMLIVKQIQDSVIDIFHGSTTDYLKYHYTQLLNDLDTSLYKDQRVVIKGCGDSEVPIEAYMRLTKILIPTVKSVMYGEPCSTVPIYKATRK